VAASTPAGRGQAGAISEAQLQRTILQTAQEGVWAVGLDGVTLFANAKMAQLLGTTHQAMVKRAVWEVFDAAVIGVVRHHLPYADRDDVERYELEVTDAEGHSRWLLVTQSPLCDDEGVHVANLSMYSDITDRKHLERELAQLSLHDTLTTLPNRALCLDRLERLERDVERHGGDLAVLFCELDRFKEVNRVHGHEVGDEVIATIAARIAHVVRDDDTVARFGGDEFVVLCPATDVSRAAELADEICAAVQPPVEVGEASVHVSMSVGVAGTPVTVVTDLLNAAGRARERAQELGRARVEVHDPARQQAGEDRARLLADLRAAIDGPEMEMYYQPIVSLRDATPVGVESLMRWQHPVLGAVSPVDFIPLAESAGLMSRLGAWGIRRACSEAAQQPVGPVGAAVNWQLAVNVSSSQLADRSLVALIQEALADTGFPASRLMLEVTEASVVTDSANATSTLRALKELGVGVAVDQFGAGYSSMTYLRQFPVDTIKIDRSFVAGMATDSDDMAIVASIVSLAAAVGVRAVAQGVETEEQAEALRRLGCPLAQGFLWSQPVPAARLHDALGALVSTSNAVGDARPGGGRRRRARPPAEDSVVIARIMALHQEGASLTTIAAALNADSLTTSAGLRWHRSSVARVIADHQFPGLSG
jgi:diguanylate cyclase (GGDEF)-like protein/PAS domain S-box-containing protein